MFHQRETLRNRIVTREDASYEIKRKTWNRAIEKYPLMFINCTTIEEVQEAILFVKEAKLPIRIRSGGHHYEGYSTGNDVVVIDVSEMNAITLNEAEGLVTLEGGVQNRAVYELLGKKGYPFPGGGCPTVGVAGLVLGGGWGYSNRLLGLSCDSLVELEIIDANGKLIRANAKEHDKLFWACKGGGAGNFGVVVRMTFKLPEKRAKATLIQLEYKNMEAKPRIELASKWQTLFKTLPYQTNMKMALYHSKEKGKGIAITGICYGDEETAFETIKPLLIPATELSLQLRYLPIFEVNRIIQDSHPDYEKYKSTGRFIYETYSDEDIKKLLEIVDDKPEVSDYTAITFYGLGGQIKEVSLESSAMFYRDAKFIMGFQSVWEENHAASKNKEWFLEKFPIIQNMTKGSFVNFPLAELEAYEAAYYGGYEESLRQIKQHYDPDNFFHFPQGLMSKK